jgi:deazaflavin-dependent oxidoreductase (nitroreductase family)
MSWSRRVKGPRRHGSLRGTEHGIRHDQLWFSEDLATNSADRRLRWKTDGAELTVSGKHRRPHADFRPWLRSGAFDTFGEDLEMSWLMNLQRWVSQGHVWLYRRTRGRLVSMGHRLIVVTTTGAKSHEPRTTPLVAFPHGEGWVVVAAAGGDHSPGWYHNMVASPDVIVERDGNRREVIAHEAIGPEREALWGRIVDEEPSYAGFQAKTERVIPVMVLEPALVTSPARAHRSDEGSKT